MRQAQHWETCPVERLPNVALDRAVYLCRLAAPTPAMTDAVCAAWYRHRSQWHLEWQPSLFKGRWDGVNVELTPAQSWILAECGWYADGFEMAEKMGFDSVKEWAEHAESMYREDAYNAMRNAATMAYRAAAAAAAGN